MLAPPHLRRVLVSSTSRGFSPTSALLVLARAIGRLLRLRQLVRAVRYPFIVHRSSSAASGEHHSSRILIPSADYRRSTVICLRLQASKPVASSETSMPLRSLPASQDRSDQHILSISRLVSTPSCCLNEARANISPLRSILEISRLQAWDSQCGSTHRRTVLSPQCFETTRPPSRPRGPPSQLLSRRSTFGANTTYDSLQQSTSNSL